MKFALLLQFFPRAQASAFGVVWVVAESISAGQVGERVERQLPKPDRVLLRPEGRHQTLKQLGVRSLVGGVSHQHLLNERGRIIPEFFRELRTHAARGFGPERHVRANRRQGALARDRVARSRQHRHQQG
jgi:hypothetical protein